MVWSGSIEEEEAELGEDRVIDGRYRIRSLLGEGGMGCVYLADDIQQGGEVALKILIPRYRGRPEREQRLLNEAILARKVGEHPRLARLLGSGRLADLDGCPFVTWEVVHGRSLNALLAVRAKLPPRMAAEWARQLADAVQAMHRAGVVHRDVTVTNIFIEGPDGDARVKLIDLSHSSVIPALGVVPNRRLTRELEVPGAHRYMSPEQARALPPNPKMDVFSFGVVLHEMLTGSNPFAHVPDRDSYIALQREGELEVARIDRRAYPGIPKPLIDLVEACTRNDMAKRADMDEVVWRLDDAISMMTTPLAFPGVKLVPQEPRSVVVVQADVVEPEVDAEIVEHGSRRSRVIIVVVALVVVLVVALLAMAWVGSRDDVGSQTSEVESPREEPPIEAPKVEPIPRRESVEVGVKEPAEVERPPRKPKRRARGKQKRKTAEPLVIPAETERCLDAVAAARQANGAHAWEAVLTHTDDPACFGSRTAWLKLLGDGSANASVGRFVEVCRFNKASQ